MKTLALTLLCSLLSAAPPHGTDGCRKAMEGRFALDLSAVTAELQKDPKSAQTIQLSEVDGKWKGLGSNQGRSEAFSATLYHYDSSHPSEDDHTRGAGQELLQLGGTKEVCWVEFNVAEKQSGTVFLLHTDFSKTPVEQLNAFIAEDGARCDWQMDAARLRKVQYLLVESKMYGVRFTPMVKLP